MARQIRLLLVRRGVECSATLADDDAPVVCAALLDALPLEGLAWHTKRSGNEVYTIVPPFYEPSYEPTPGPELLVAPVENPVVLPGPGDVVVFALPAGVIPPGDPRHVVSDGTRFVSCISTFYDRDNVHLTRMGLYPGTRVAEIAEGLEVWRDACTSVWYEGAAGERLEILRG